MKHGYFLFRRNTVLAKSRALLICPTTESTLNNISFTAVVFLLRNNVTTESIMTGKENV